jgi:hypothetical protein
VSLWLKLCSLNDFARFDAASADFDVAHGLINNRAHALQIRIETPLGAVVGVTYTIAELRPFITNLTSHRHGN